MPGARRRAARLGLRAFGLLPTRLAILLAGWTSPAYRVGAVCVVTRDDGRLLLVRLSYRDGWWLPGGLVRRREEPADCVRRELLEEVGLAVELLGGPAPVVETRLHRVNLVFVARPAAGADPDAARPASAEIVEVGWFDPAALPDLDEPVERDLRAAARCPGPGAALGTLPRCRAPGG